MTRRLSTLIACTAASLASLMAQRPSHDGGTPPDPATFVQRRVDRLATMLSLTDAQKSSATTTFTTALTASTSLRENLSQARQSLQDAVKANSTTAIDSQSLTIGTLTGQLAAIDGKANAAFYAILNADQKAKFDEMGNFGPGPGGPGGPGGPRRRGFGGRDR